MPRNTRNAWISADISGRKTTLEGGPVSKDGGMNARIYYRENGAVSRDTILITVQPYGDELNITIYHAGEIVFTKTVIR